MALEDMLVFYLDVDMFPLKMGVQVIFFCIGISMYYTGVCVYIRRFGKS